MAESKLGAYHEKRNFERTMEPEGGAGKPEGAFRFAVQHHLARAGHYDLRLEWDGVLLSWAVPKGPSYNTRDKRLAIRVEDHPLEYRTFEGTIPKGEYGGGVVMLWDEGVWEPCNAVEAGLREGMLKFCLRGTRLMGRWALVRLRPKADEGKENWLLLKERDAFSKPSEGISQWTVSVKTGRSMEEIERGEHEKIAENPFFQADVQLAKLVSEIPGGSDWLFELKYDGYRMLSFMERGRVLLRSRNGKDYTNQFEPVASSLRNWAAGRAMVLDGELAVTDPSGRTDFQALQNYTRPSGGESLIYIVFDLLALDGTDLRNHPLEQRKAALEALMKDAPPNLHYSRHVRGNGAECLQAACQSGMEGIVGKKADSPYSGARNGDWIKLKCRKRQEFVIGGYTRTDKKAQGISALLLGVYEGETLCYAGRAGSGLSQRGMMELEERFRNFKRETAPFQCPPKPRANETITWLAPELAAEIQFAQWTKDGLLRQASVQGIREDKNPRDIRREGEKDMEKALSSPRKTGEREGGLIIQGVKITNPDKRMFSCPDITKGDVVRYYEQVSERMLPYVQDRLLSIVRCPGGISGTCFYKKHPGPGGGAIVPLSISGAEGETEPYFYIENGKGLISEAQMGTLEFHVWGSRAGALEQPDIMVFDLDPDEGMDLALVRRGVRDLKSVLTELALPSYLKTSGGKGYHVAVPFQPAASWDAFHDFAKKVSPVMEQRWPERYTSNPRKVKRTGKIFIDWMRNGRGATSVAPYSVRARAGARVSMPIAWEALDTVAPDGVDMAEALRRIREKDPWEGFFQAGQKLK
ncbi:MAG: DNA ligase D [Oscillospiraceae bacterium]|nr:DNA ligase D [Oscillospiraceae bacterium]